MEDADPDYSDGSSNSDEVESSELTDPDSTDEVDTTKDVDLEEDVDLMEVDTAGPDDAGRSILSRYVVGLALTVR